MERVEPGKGGRTAPPFPVLPVSPEEAAGSVRFVPADSLHTSYARLRPGVPRPRLAAGTELPLRVAPRESGGFEVLDGFKRLGRWRAEGRSLVPVVVESPASAAEHKRLLLVANAPPRTLTALDEARVVCSLIREDGFGPQAVARLLGHRPEWVARRFRLGTRLGSAAEDRLGKGAIGPSLAVALTDVPVADQDALCGAIERHGLGGREAMALVGAYRVADEAERRALLRDPLGVLRSEEAPSPTLSPRARDLEAELGGFRRMLRELGAFRLPDDLAPPERRRLAALRRCVLAELRQTAAVLCAEIDTDGGTDGDPSPAPKEEEHVRRRPQAPVPIPISAGAPGTTATCAHAPEPTPAGPQAGRDHPADPRGDHPAQGLLRRAEDRPPCGPLAQARAPRARGGGVLDRTVADVGARGHDREPREQARPLPGAHRDAGEEGPDRDPHPARDPGSGLPGRPDDPGRAHPEAAHGARPPPADVVQAPLRDRPG
jgi:hypothetical protein